MLTAWGPAAVVLGVVAVPAAFHQDPASDSIAERWRLCETPPLYARGSLRVLAGSELSPFIGRPLDNLLGSFFADAGFPRLLIVVDGARRLDLRLGDPRIEQPNLGEEALRVEILTAPCYSLSGERFEGAVHITRGRGMDEEEGKESKSSSEGELGRVLEGVRARLRLPSEREPAADLGIGAPAAGARSPPPPIRLTFGQPSAHLYEPINFRGAAAVHSLVLKLGAQYLRLEDDEGLFLTPLATLEVPLPRRWQAMASLPLVVTRTPGAGTKPKVGSLEAGLGYFLSPHTAAPGTWAASAMFHVPVGASNGGSDYGHSGLTSGITATRDVRRTTFFGHFDYRLDWSSPGGEASRSAFLYGLAVVFRRGGRIHPVVGVYGEAALRPASVHESVAPADTHSVSGGLFVVPEVVFTATSGTVFKWALPLGAPDSQLRWGLQFEAVFLIGHERTSPLHRPNRRPPWLDEDGH